MQPKVLLIYPFTSSHLGLFDDLFSREDVILFEAGERSVGRLGAFFRRVHRSRRINRYISLPLKTMWYRFPPVFRYKDSLEKVIIIDGALNQLPESYMRRLKNKYPRIQFYVYMINALEAASPIIQNIRQYILEFPWEGVYTFDPDDAEKYNLNYLGFCYYTKHMIGSEDIEDKAICDAYFIGGLKGGRDNEVLSVYDYLLSNNVKCNFNLMVYGNSTMTSKEGLTYFSNGWRPYEEVLNGIQLSNCIIEILQHGQSGPSLRYFEAVCYNKKLLTNNPNIVNFPYYDSRFMKVFTSPEDIDVDWIKADLSLGTVDYHYKGDFSPNTMVDFFLNQ